MLSFGIGIQGEYAASHDDALKVVEGILRKEAWPARVLRRRKKRLLSGHLALKRHHDFANEDLFNEIEFLNGEPHIVGASVGDLELAESFLQAAREETHNSRKMSRTWLCVRCLMHKHYRMSSDPRVLALWEDALRTWSKLAGWRGLHAHLWLGHVATLGSLVSVLRRQGRSVAAVDGLEHADNVGGAFASVYYSLSKIVRGKMSGSFLSRAGLYVENGLSAVDRSAHSGLYAIRGSINLRRGHTTGAISDYRNALGDAIKFAHGEHRIGELLAELGWAEVRSGRIWDGRAHIEEGVRLMDVKVDEKVAGAGFRTRGGRKLTAVRAATMDFSGALRSARSANALIKKHGLDDQKDIVLNTAERIDTLINLVKMRGKNW